MVGAHGVLVQEGPLPSGLGRWVRRGLRRLLRVTLEWWELVRLRIRTELSKMFGAKLKGASNLMGCGAAGPRGSTAHAPVGVWRNQRGGRGPERKWLWKMVLKTLVCSSMLKQATRQSLSLYRTQLGSTLE